MFAKMQRRRIFAINDTGLFCRTYIFFCAWGDLIGSRWDHGSYPCDYNWGFDYLALL